METNGRTMKTGDDDRDESNHPQQQENQAAAAERRSGGELLGRHRLSAANSRLDKEIESLQKELEELDTMEPSSSPCKQLISSTQRLPDPLLPVTRGPENAEWDRWFQRIRSSRDHKWYSFKRTT